MKNFYKIAQVLVFSFYFLGVKAQIHEPTLIPPTPRAQTFNIYGDIPVQKNTGVPSISIPLYTIKSGDYELPITLDYHIHSVKPGFDNSNVGFGWTINVGGMISRTIKGHPDDRVSRPTTWLTNPIESDYEDFQYLAESTSGVIDVEYDIFNYNLPGYSGEFILEFDDDKIITHDFPHQPLNFAPTLLDGTYGFKNINITAPDGVKYKFGGSGCEETINPVNGWPDQPGWRMNDILTPKGDSITFKYNEFVFFRAEGDYVLSINDDSKSHTFNPDANCGGSIEWENNTLVEYRSTVSLYGKSLTLKEINFDLGKIIFSLSSDSKLIESFTVYDLFGVQVYKVEFLKDKFQGTNYNRLNSIKCSNKQEQKSYDFFYNENYLINDYYKKDFFGYYNGIGGTEKPRLREIQVVPDLATTTPYKITRGFDYYFPNEVYLKAQTLKEIKYPTKDSTHFNWEINKYMEHIDGDHIANGSGLRIQKITNKDVLGNVLNEKSYQYTVGEMKHSPLLEANVKRERFFGVGQFGCANYLEYRKRTFLNSIHPDLDSKVRYSQVTELLSDNSNNLGSIIYNYTYNNSHLYSSRINHKPFPRASMVPFLSTYANWGNGLLSYTTYKNSSGQTVKKNAIQYHHYYSSIFNNLRVDQLSDYSYGSPDLYTSYFNKWDSPPGYGSPNIQTLYLCYYHIL